MKEHGEATRVEVHYRDGAIQVFDGVHAEEFMTAIANACVLSSLHGVPVKTVPHTWERDDSGDGDNVG